MDRRPNVALHRLNRTNINKIRPSKELQPAKKMSIIVYLLKDVHVSCTNQWIAWTLTPSLFLPVASKAHASNQSFKSNMSPLSTSQDSTSVVLEYLPPSACWPAIDSFSSQLAHDKAFWLCKHKHCNPH